MYHLEKMAKGLIVIYLRDALNEARTRGLSDVVNSQYPNVNKVAALDPPKPTDRTVKKLCQQILCVLQ